MLLQMNKLETILYDSKLQFDNHFSVTQRSLITDC